MLTVGDRRMNTPRPLIASLVAASLAGCSPSLPDDTGVTDTHIAASENGGRGFQFESGFLPFGDFDPQTLGNNVFDPCEDITAEEFAAAGWPRTEGKKDVTPKGNIICPVQSGEKFLLTDFINGSVNRQVMEENGVIFEQYGSELLPEMYVFGPGDGISDCFTRIDTPRGAIGASAGGASTFDQETLCQIAITMTEDLFRAHGRG